MTCTGGRLACLLKWRVNRPSPVMSTVRRLPLPTGVLPVADFVGFASPVTSATPVAFSEFRSLPCPFGVDRKIDDRNMKCNADGPTPFPIFLSHRFFPLLHVENRRNARRGGEAMQAELIPFPLPYQPGTADAAGISGGRCRRW